MTRELVTYRVAGGSGAVDADPVTTEVVRNSLNIAANQMKRAIVRTAFSPCIVEVLDFAVAIYDRRIRMLAQAPSMPIFMGTMNFCVESAVASVGGEENLEPGDIIIYNDPFGMGSHQQDLALVAGYQPRDHVEAGGLARAVRAEQPDHLVVVRTQRDLRDDLPVAVGLAQSLGFKRGH